MKREKKINLLKGDCLEVLKRYPDNYFDSVVTDPPASISFMGKEWDNDKGGRSEWIHWLRTAMEEVLRTMKPGAHGLVWSLPRTSHWTGMALELAGFEIRDCIVHHFGAGFPKSQDIGKAIDKQAGAKRKRGVLRHDAHKLNKKETEHPGGWKTGRREYYTAEPATSEAKQWEGYGTALKPASEYWWLIRKPLSEKTIAKNVLKWGTGGINIDGCRVPGVLEGDPNRFAKAYSQGNGHEGWKRKAHDNYDRPVVRSEGRWPANVILSHSPGCKMTGKTKTKGKQGGYTYSDKSYEVEGFVKDCKPKAPSNYGGEEVEVWECTEDCPIRAMNEQSGLLKNGGYVKGNEGGASRFFHNFIYKSKASKKDKGADNTHPTVKSTELMEFLIKLITPPEGRVLDPFMGSGSTGFAAKRLGFKFIGIEKEKEYYEIAKKRSDDSN